MLIEGIEVNSGRTTIFQFGCQVCRPLDSDSPLVFGVLAVRECRDERLGRFLARQFEHSFKSAERGDGHNAGQYRNGDSGVLCRRDKVKIFLH